MVCPSGGYCNRAVHEGETMGEHGLGLAPEVPYVSKWAEDLDRWLTYKEWK